MPASQHLVSRASRRPVAAALAVALLASSAQFFLGAAPAWADAWTQDSAGVDTVGARAATTASYLPPVVVDSSHYTTTTPTPRVDAYALYGVDLPPAALTSNAYNVATIDPATGKNTLQFAWRVPVDRVEQRTVAVDSGLGSGTEGFYDLYRGPYISAAGTPAGMMPVWFYAPGDTKASKMWYVPDLGYFHGTTATWTNGGAVVDQETGRLYINAGLLQFIGGTSNQDARFTIFDPKTLTTYWSGSLQPAAASDHLWTGAAITDPGGGLGPGAVVSGIAIMPDGDFVVLVRGTNTAIPATDPMNTTGTNIVAGTNTIGFLVRIHPSFSNAPWTYSVMKMITHDPSDHAVTPSGKTMWNAANVQALAFYGGKLVVETSNAELFSVDPITGYWKYLSVARNTTTNGPVSPSYAPQAPSGLFYSLSSAQTATSLKGHVYRSESTTYDTSTPLAGVTVALYEQNPAGGYAQPTLIGTTVTDGAGQYTFLLPDTAADGSVKYFVRPITELIAGWPSVMVAGGVKTSLPFGGLANDGTLFCVGGTTYHSAGDGVMASGPCRGLINPPALEAMGTAVDPATFGAYASIVMTTAWNQPVIDFNLMSKSAVPPSISKPADGAVLVSATPTIEGAGTAGDTITVKDGSGNTVCTTTVKDDGTWTCTPTSPLATGPATWTAIQADPITGATSAPSAAVHVTIDTTPPAITSPKDGDLLTTNKPALSGTGTNGTTVTVKDGAGNPIPGCTDLTVTAGAWTCTPTTALPQGANTLTPVTKDSLGDTVAGTPVNVTIDTVAPDAPVITSPTAGSTTDQATVTISGTGEKDAVVTVKDGTTTVCTATVSATGTWSCDGTFTEGDHTLTAVQTDKAGNTSDPSAPVTFTVDFELNVPSAKESFLTLDSTTPLVDTPATATVTVKNYKGTVLSGVTATVTVPATTSATAKGDSGVAGTSATCVTGTDGTCKVVINDHVAEDVDVSAFVPIKGVSTEITNSPTTVTFKAGPHPCTDPTAVLNKTAFDVAATTSATAPLRAGVPIANGDAATDYWTGTLTATDCNGNPVTGASGALTFTSSDTTNITISAITESTTTPGVYTVKYTTTTASDDYTASVSVVGVDLTGAAKTGTYGPKAIPFQAGKVCLPQIEVCDPVHFTHVSVDPNNSPADGVTADVINAYAYDAKGNPVEGVNFVLDKGTYPVTLDPTTIVSNGDGWGSSNATSTTSTTPGTPHLVKASVNGTELTGTGGSPLQLFFSAGSADAAHSSLMVDKTSTTAGATIVATASAFDSSGNPVTSGTTFTFSVTSPSGKASVGSSCTTPAGSNSCTVNVTDTVAEDVVLHAMLGTTDIGGYYLTLTPVVPSKASPQTLTFTAGPCDPGASTSTITATSPVNVGENSTVTVSVTDQYGNAACTTTTPTINLSVNGSATFGAGTAQTATCTLVAGTCTATVTDKTAETVTVNGTMGTTAIGDGKGADIVFQSMSADAAHSTFTVDKTTTDVGLPITGTLTAFDALDNQLGSGIIFDVTVSSASGKATVKSGSGAAGAGASCTTTAAGTCTVTITDTVADEPVTVHATLGGVEVGTFYAATAPAKASPKTLTFTAGCIETGHDATPPETNVDNDHRSNVQVTLNNQTANGTAADVATVSLFDRYGNPSTWVCEDNGGTITKVPAVITTTATAPLVAAAPQPGATGVWTIDYTSTVANTYSAPVLVNGTPIAFVPQPGSALEGNAAEIAKRSSPVSLTFGYGNVSGVNSSITVNPVPQMAGSPVTVTVTVKDDAGNPIPDLVSSDFVMSGTASLLPNLVFTGFAPGTAGQYMFTTTSKLVGTFTIAGTVKGVAVDHGPGGVTDKPVVATFIAGDVCVTNCTPIDNPATPGVDESKTNFTQIKMVTNDQPADGSSQDTAVGSAFDAYGNPVAGATFTVTDATTGANPAGVSLVGKLTPGTQTSGATGADGKTSPVAWKTTTFGTYTATATVKSGAMVNGLEVTNSDLNAIRFAAGNIDASKSQLTITPASPQQVGSAYTAKALIVDASGNPLQGVTVSFSTDPATSQISDPTCQTGAAGTCSTMVNSVFAKTYQVHATVPIAGVQTDLGGNGDPAKSSPQQVAFYAGTVCMTNCTPVDDPSTPGVDESKNFTGVKVDPNNAVANGTDHDGIIVSAYDKYGNAVAPVAVVATPPAGVSLAAMSVTTDATTGKAMFSATSTTAGTYSVPVAIGGQSVTGSPALVTFIPGAIGGVTLTIAPTTSQRVGSTFAITAKVTDATGNGVGGTLVTYTLPAGLTTGAGLTTASCTTDDTGVCPAVQVTSTKAGSYPVTATAGAATSNTVTAVFTPGPVDALKSTVTVNPNGVAFDGVAQDIATVTARDSYGNPVPGAAVASVLTAGQTGDAANLTIQPNIAPTGPDGTTTIWYTSTAPGEKKADVSITDPSSGAKVAPSGSPISLLFGAGNGDAAHSSWAITPAGPLVVGDAAASTYTLSATINDVFDKPVQGVVVTFKSAPATTMWGATPQTCVTVADGTCQVSVTSHVATTFAFTATIPTGKSTTDPLGDGLAKSAAWTPGPVDGANSSAVVTTDGETADGNARDIVTVTAKDQYGNLVPGQIVTTTPGDADLTAQTGIAATGDGSDPLQPLGTTTIWYSSKVAGAHTATVLIGAAQVEPKGPAGSSPVTMHFSPGAVDPGKSTLVLDRLTQEVGKDVIGTITTRDANGNLKSGTVTVSVDLGTVRNAPSVAATKSVTCTTDVITATCAVTITDTLPELVTVTATVAPAGTPAPITGSGQKVQFTAGDGCTTPDPTVDNDHRSNVQVTLNDQLADGTAADIATVSLFDQYGNPTDTCGVDGAGAPKDAVITSTPLPSGLTLAASPPQPAHVSTGVWTLSYTSTVANTYSAPVLVNGTELKFVQQPGVTPQLTLAEVAKRSSPVSLTFVYGNVSGVNSSITVNPVSQMAGSPVTVTVSVKDAANNPIPNLTAADFVMSGVASSLPDLVFTGFAPGTAGDYKFTTTSKLVGTFTISGMVKGVLVDHGPAGVTDKPVTATFTAGDVCVSNCTPVDNPSTPVDESKTNFTQIKMVTNDQPADGSSQDTAVGSAFDAYGNPVAGATFAVTDATTGANPAGVSLVGKLTPGTQVSGATGADGRTSPVAWTSITFGTYTATATVKSGAMVNGLEVTNSDLNAIRFAAGNIDASKSALMITPASPIQVGSAYMAKALIVDASGNPLQGVTVSFYTAPATSQLSDVTCQTGLDGTCQISVGSEFAKTYQVHATVPIAGVQTDLGGGGVPAKASPQQVGFYPGTVCMTNCTPVDDPSTPGVDESQNYTGITVDPNNAVANGTDHDGIIVSAYDKYGNAVAPVAVVAAPPAGVTMATSVTTDATTGKAVFSATSTAAGTYSVPVAIGGAPVTGSPARVTFVPGALGGVTLTIAPTTSQVAGSTFAITAKVTDATNNGIGGTVVTFNLPAGLTTGTGLTAAQCTTASTGLCDPLQVTSTKAGSYPVTASAGSKTSNTVTAVFTPGPVDALKSTVTVDPNGVAFDGVARDVATVTVMDRYGNPIKDAQVSSTLVAGESGDLKIQPGIAPTGADGTTTIWYTSLTAGTQHADVKVIDPKSSAVVTPTGSPVALLFGAGNGDAAHSSWAITPAGPLVVGDAAASTYTLSATINDVFDKPVQGVVVTFKSAPATTMWGATPQTCVTIADGTCHVSVTSHVATTFAFTATIPTGKSPTDPLGDGLAKSAAWTPGPVSGANSSVVVTKDHQTADGNARDIVTVTARDQYGNLVPGQIVTTTPGDAQLSAQTGIAATSDGTDGRDPGTTTIWYSSTKSGAHTATVLIGAAQVEPKSPSGSSPVTLNFDPGVPDAGKSTLVLSPASPTVGDPVTATVTARDAQGNPVPGTVMTVTVPATSQAGVSDGSGTPGDKTATCTTGATGTCMLTVKDTKAETVQVRGLVPTPAGPADVSGSPKDLTFAPGPCVVNPVVPNPGPDNDHRTNVRASVNGKVANGSEKDVVTLQIFDADGNLTDNCTPGGSGTTPAAPDVTAGPVTDVTVGTPVHVSVGTWTIEYSSLKAATYAAPVRVNGAEVKFVQDPAGVPQLSAAQVAAKSSPVSLTFVAGPVSAIESALTADVKTQTVGGNIIAQVTVRDANKNLVPGVTATLAVDGSATLTPVAPAQVKPLGSMAVPRGVASPDAQCTTGTGGVSLGVCQVVVSDTVAEPVLLRATVPVAGVATNVAGSPMGLSFTPGCVSPDGSDSVADDAHRSNVKVTTNNQKAGGSLSDVATVRLFDKYGNPAENKCDPVTGQPIPGTVVDVTTVADDPSKLIAGVVSKTPNMIGVWTIPYTTPVPTAATYPAKVFVDKTEIQFRVVDPATKVTTVVPGMSSPARLSFVDLTSPGAPTITFPADNGLTNARPVPVAGVAEPGSMVKVYDGTNTTPVCTVTASSTGAWTCPATLTDGVHALTATATDTSGNTSPPSSVVKVTVDTKAPGAPRVDVANGTKVAGDPGSSEPGATITLTWPDKSTGTTTVKPDGSWTIDTPKGMVSGDISVTATDPAGNTSPATPKYLDTQPPGAPKIDVANAREVAGGPGSAEKGATITVTWPDGSKSDPVRVGPDGSWSVPTPPGMKSGEVTAIATDPAGNVSQPGTAMLDTQAPDSPVITTANKTQIAGTAEKGSTVRVTIPMVGAPDQVIEVAADPNTGAWSVKTPVGAKDGGVVTAVATDKAGNTSGPATAILDMSAPAKPVVDPTDGKKVSGTSEPGAKITVTDATGKPVPGCAGVLVAANGTYTCTPVTPITPGATISVVAVDPAGNVSEPTTVKILDRKLVVSNPSINAGAKQTVTGTGWAPGETVTVTMCSTCQVVGTATADKNGSFSLTFTVPTGTPAGAHTLTASGSLSSKALGGDVSITFTVAALAPTGGAAGGTTTGRAGLVAVLLAAASMGVLLIRRRRDEATT